MMWAARWAVGFLALSSGLAAQGTLAIRDVAIVPMDRERVLEGQTLLIRGDRIEAIGPAIEIPSGATVIDGRGKYLMPGLCDMHMHVNDVTGYRLGDWLAQGVTTVRNMAGRPAHLDLREQIEAGELLGPRLFTAGPLIDGDPPIWPSLAQVARTPEDAARLVREQHEAGYDFVKIYSRLTPEAYDAVARTAAELSMPVVGHVPLRAGIPSAIRTAQRSVEHLFTYAFDARRPGAVDLAAMARGQFDFRLVFQAIPIDPERLAELARGTADAGVWNCPTLVVFEHHCPHPMALTHWRKPELRALGRSNRMATVRALHAAGAPLLLGTDYPARHVSEELELLVEAGLSPFEALRCATVNPARWLGLEDEIGTVEVGKCADLVLVTDNPLLDVRRLFQVEGVVRGGRWLTTEDLAGLKSTRPEAVRQVDHVLVRVEDPAAVFQQLTEELGLPVAWPLMKVGPVRSAGVGFGNANLELLGSPDAPGFAGLAFEPTPLVECLAELDARGVAHTDPAPFPPTGPARWTSSVLSELGTARTPVFLCEYHHDVHAHRARTRAALKSNDGGALGVVSMAELALEVPDLGPASRLWSELLDPDAQGARSRWHVGSGPAIRLASGEDLGLRSIRIKVRSLEQARRALDERGLLATGSAPGEAVWSLGPGVVLTFVE